MRLGFISQQDPNQNKNQYLMKKIKFYQQIKSLNDLNINEYSFVFNKYFQDFYKINS